MKSLAWPHLSILVLASILWSTFGCRSRQQGVIKPSYATVHNSIIAVDYPDAKTDSELNADTNPTLPPFTLANQSNQGYWDLPLDEAIRLAIQNSPVLHNLGGTILSSPLNATSIHSPAIQDTDPRFGVEGALSAFDAQWSTKTFFANNDRALNNVLLGGGTRTLQQDILNYSSELSKLTATGTRFAVRNNIAYDFNNATGNAVPNRPWTTNIEVDGRAPLLRGGGVTYNRIAGPFGAPGVYNGVLIARINMDISLADFEAGVRDMVNDVETAYWELYFAYRNLDATISARQRALESWQRIQALKETGRRGGSAEAEARAREQYYRLEGEVQNSLAGRTQERGSLSSLRGVGGVQGNERRLRLLMGVAINDGRLIRPATEPTQAPIGYDWNSVTLESLTRRVELRRQHSVIRRREFEVIASKNHLLPQLDLFTRYRWRGLGHDLLDPNGAGKPAFDNAFQDLLDGRFQEWEAGVEYLLPIGLRQGHAAVRHATLRLCHEKAVLKQQEREVLLEVSDAIAEKDRAYGLAQTHLNRLIASKQELEATQALYDGANEADRTRLLDLLLDAQRRLADSESQYYRTITEYMLAIKQVHYSKGTLLDYNQIVLTESYER